MANWYGTSLSNAFKVKDVDAFEKALKDVEIEVVRSTDTEGPLVDTVRIYGEDEYGGWPSGSFDEDDEWIELDLPALIAPHLADGWVCVLEEVGNEKQRYVSGYAQAFNNKGEQVTLQLSDIFELAKDLGEHITGC